MNIGTDFILNHFDENSIKRLLTEDEILDLVEKTKFPFPGVKKVVDLINDRLELVVRENVETLQLYECMIPVFIQYIENKFLASLVDPGTPIGPITSDAIGQQATQVLLNTFHSAGSAKSGGPDGIRENISISANRKTLYSSLHFNNSYFTLDEVLPLKRDFIGIVLEDLMESILPINVDIGKHLSDKSEPTSVENGKEMFENGLLWWYKGHDFSMVDHTYERMGIRIKLNVMKMFNFRITTEEIANILSKYIFKPKTTKNNNGTYNTIDLNIIPIVSPTFIGVIDFYISSENPIPTDYKLDHFLQFAVDSGEINNIVISGIPGIQNFYPMSIPVTSIIRSVEKDRDGRGTWIYFKNMRFSGVPIKKFVHLCKESGLDVDESNQTSIENIEYHSYKIEHERRSKIEVKCLSVSNEKTDLTNKFLNITNFTPGERRLHVFFSEDQDFDHITSRQPIVFPSKEILMTAINEVNNHPELTEARNYFNFPGMQEYYIFSLEVAFGDSFGFVIGAYLFTNTYEVEVDINMINRVKNLTTLETVVNKVFGFKRYSINQKYRLPEIKTIKRESKEKNRILIKSTACFRDEFDPIDEKTGEVTKMSPLDRLITTINENVTDDRIKTYVYAETRGSNLDKICAHPLIDTRKTFCNHFRETFAKYGIEGLRNLLAYDLLNMVNNEGYINPKYPLTVADVITSHGLNPMTSEGVSSQGNGVISTITFDNPKKYIEASAIVGGEESSSSVSTCIFWGIDFNLGTGYAKTKFDPFTHKRIELSNLTRSDISNFKTVDHEGNEVKFEFANEIKLSKFPTVNWVISAYISKDIFYYIKVGINSTRRIPKKPTSARLNILNYTVKKVDSFGIKIPNFKMKFDAVKRHR